MHHIIHEIFFCGCHGATRMVLRTDANFNLPVIAHPIENHFTYLRGWCSDCRLARLTETAQDRERQLAAMPATNWYPSLALLDELFRLHLNDAHQRHVMQCQGYEAERSACRLRLSEAADRRTADWVACRFASAYLKLQKAVEDEEEVLASWEEARTVFLRRKYLEAETEPESVG
ncbi:MAG: hypothetical protein M1826_007088 [Phylliscum demangeonii]|nr:MAG: hypothetical protein M1826_007088 [Phylliscum demangeonii]